MTLRINSTAPDFKAETTQGPIEFHKWIGDGWAILFSHPKDFTPVCTTELGYMAGLKPEFDKRNTKIVGLSVDPVTNHSKWAKDIEETQGHAVTYPMIGDPELKVATAYDMLPEGAGTTSEGRTAADNATVRSVFIIGPDKKIKAMLTYPMSTGRNFDEVLRLLESCQLTAKHQVATPVNWKTRRGRHHRPGGLRRGRQGQVSRTAGRRPSPTCASSRSPRTEQRLETKEKAWRFSRPRENPSGRRRLNWRPPIIPRCKGRGGGATLAWHQYRPCPRRCIDEQDRFSGASSIAADRRGGNSIRRRHLWRLPFAAYNNLSLGAFEDHQKAYEATAPNPQV